MPNMKNGRSSFSEKNFVFEKIEFKNHFRGAKFKPAATTADCAEHPSPPSARSISSFLRVNGETVE